MQVPTGNRGGPVLLRPGGTAKRRQVRARISGPGDAGHDSQHLTFTVTDDGTGFDPATTSMGTGLQGMTDRLAALGGTLMITSAPGRGTKVTGRVPAAC